VAAVNLITRASAPLPFYIARATGAHQLYGLDAPDQGVFMGLQPDLWIGPVEINSNILPLDLFLFLIFVFHLNHSITYQCIGRASS